MPASCPSRAGPGRFPLAPDARPRQNALMAQIPDMTSDCQSCAALCCIALAFDAGDEFAIDKPAGLPCPNLDGALGCQHYAHLEAEGFRGCVTYECRGAGQRVTQELFEGDSWANSPAITAPMLEAFAAMRRVHDGIDLLIAAERLDLPPSFEAERQALLEAYAPDEGWTRETLAAFATGDAPRRLAAFLPRLREFV